MWPFKKKTAENLPTVSVYPKEQLLAASSEHKAFDWYHYQMTQYEGGYFGDEFSSMVSKETLKASAVKEIDIAKGMNAITRQFLGATFHVMSGEKGSEQFSQNRITETLRNGIYEESNATFHMMRMFDLIATGEAFAFIADNGAMIASLPSERIERLYQDGKLVSYRYQTKNGSVQTFDKKNIIEWKLPNPFSRHAGISVLLSLLMEILTRKYGKEWTVGFFLRGGAMASQYHTELNDASSLARLMASIQQMVGSRRNMHNDKLLPKGVTLAAPSAPFASVQISELLRNNARDVFSLMGVPPVAVGDTDGVNYASADQQMKFFWHATILPYQKIYTSCIMNNDIVKTFFKPGQYIVFDNSGNSYLDDFSDKLTQDAGLAPILTVDERRQRLGYEPIGDDRGAKLESELSSSNAGMFSLSMEKKTAEPTPETPPEPEFPSIIKRIAQDEPASKEAWDYVMAEVKEWEKIALASLESQDDAHKSIQGRANEYGRSWSKMMNAEVMAVWDAQLAMLGTPEAKGIHGALTKGEKEDRLMEFRARSVDFLLRQVAAEAEGRFAGFSETWTKRIYSKISELIGKNYSLSDIASELKMNTFGQYYEGQMKTVVNTEFRSSLHKGSSRFGSDLSKVAKTLSKIWLARIDPATRDSHVELDGRAITGDAKDVAEMSFLPGITLRYPMDGAAPAGEVINCRCAMRYKVLEWRD